VQPPAVVSACQRRSRASITAMTTSSRCKPSPQRQWRPWPRSCACVLWGDHGFMPSLRRGVAGNARGLGSATAQRRWAHAVPHSGGACVRHSAAVCGAPELPERPAQHTDNRHCARRRQTSIIGMQPQRPRCAVRQVNKRTHCNSRHASTLPMLQGWDQSRCRCGSGEPSPCAD
jgi:hypothetical protein